jgi:hypothetical protein
MGTASWIDAAKPGNDRGEAFELSLSHKLERGN